jgi:hypothetical protein
MTEEKHDGSQSLLLDIYNRLATVEAQNNHIMAAQGRADDSRREIHEKLNQFALVSQTVQRIEPIVLRLEAMRQQAVGASALGEILAKAIYGIIGAAIAVAGWLAHALMAKPPH